MTVLTVVVAMMIIHVEAMAMDQVYVNEEERGRTY